MSGYAWAIIFQHRSLEYVSIFQSTNPKSKSLLMKIKKTFGMERSASKKKMKVNVEKDNVPPPRPTTTPTATTAQNTSLNTSPSVVRTRAEVTAHVMTSQPHSVTSQPHAVTSQVSHASSQPAPCTPTAPQPTPEPATVPEYEPDNKPGKQVSSLC